VLLASKADVNAKGNNGTTPLHEAAGIGSKDVVELLLAKGADVNARDGEGDTPLHRAAAAGHKDVVELLLANKANVNARDDSGMTPLKAANPISPTMNIVVLLRKARFCGEQESSSIHLCRRGERFADFVGVLNAERIHRRWSRSRASRWRCLWAMPGFAGNIRSVCGGLRPAVGK